MKKILILPFLVFSLLAVGQYDPQKATVTNKPLGVAQAVPTDARTYFYSPTLFMWRPYQSTAEVLATLNTTKSRTGHFPIIVNVGGALQSNGSFLGGTFKEYWFKDGTSDVDLVEKTSSTPGTGGEIASGTVAQLRAMSTTTGRNYTSTDFGGGDWVDIGPYDGQFPDDGALYLVTANNKVLKRQYSGAVNAGWFGIVGNGITDSSNKIQTILNTYNDVYFPDTSYVINHNIAINNRTKAKITGGINTKFKSTGTGRFAGAYLNFTNCSNIDISGITFDLGKGRISATYSSSDYGTWYNIGVNFEGCSNMVVTRCNFTNLYNRSINVHTGSGAISFTQNTFSSPVQNQGYAAEHIAVVTFAGNADISDNKFINAAYTLPEFGICNINVSPSTGSVRVANNYMDYSGRDNTYTHRVCGIDFYSNSENVTIENNKMFHVMGQAIRTKDGRNFKIMGNYVEVTAVGIDPIIEISSVTAGIETENIEVANNILKTAISGLYALEVVETFKNRQIKNVNIHDNTFDGFSFGVYCVNGINGLTSTDNTFKNAVNGYYITSQFTDTAAIENIYISDKNTSFSGIGINIGMPNGFNGKIDKINVEDNTLTGSSPSFIGVASININKPDILTVKHNRIKNGTVGIYTRDAVSSYIFDNIVDSCTYPTLDVGFSYAKQKGNYFNGVLQDIDSVFLRSPSGTINYHQKVINNRVIGNSTVSDDGTTTTAHGPLLALGDVLTTGRVYTNSVLPGDNSAVFQNTSPTGFGIFSKAGYGPDNYAFDLQNGGAKHLLYGKGIGARVGVNNVTPIDTLDVDGTGRFRDVVYGVPATAFNQLITRQQATDTLNARYAASTFILRNALGTGASSLYIPNTSTAIAKKIIAPGTVETDTTITISTLVGNTGNLGFTANGSTTSFTFVTSGMPLYTVDAKVFLEPTSAMGLGAFIEWIEHSTESFTVHFNSAPSAGAKTMRYLITP